VTRRPVLGDFLVAAHEQLTRPTAPANMPAPGRDAEEIGASLHRLITALTRITADLATSFGNFPEPVFHDLSASGRAALHVHHSLSRAAALARFPTLEPRPSNELARRLDRAALSLTTGRDLIQTHFRTSSHGRRQNLTRWARVIASRPVAWALLDEITVLARQAADAGTAALAASPLWPIGLDQRLRLTCQWLALVGAPGATRPVPGADRDLLFAIPGVVLPARRLPSGGELVAELCDAVTTTSERVSHQAWTAAHTAAGSAAISATSWRKIASAATATSHHCHLLLTAAADRAARGESGQAAAVPALAAAADRALLSRAAWLRTAEALAKVTTDVRWPPSRAAADAADLALWTGRLAYDTPDWVPASGPRHPTRRPHSLAPAPDDVPRLVAAAHYAMEAVHELAVSTHTQVQGAVRAGRVLTPAKTLPADPERTEPFAPVPRRQASDLLDYHATTVDAGRRAVTAVAAVARELHAPSAILATARATQSASQNLPRRTASLSSPGPTAPRPAGPVEAGLRELGVTSSPLLSHTAGVDALAREVIRDAACHREGGEPLVAAQTTLGRDDSSPRRGQSGVQRDEAERVAPHHDDVLLRPGIPPSSGRSATARRSARAAQQEREAER
jgi:hypothetical protein